MCSNKTLLAKIGGRPDGAHRLLLTDPCPRCLGLLGQILRNCKGICLNVDVQQPNTFALEFNFDGHHAILKRNKLESLVEDSSPSWSGRRGDGGDGFVMIQVCHWFLRRPLFFLGLDFLLWLSGGGWGWNGEWDVSGRRGVELGDI